MRVALGSDHRGVDQVRALQRYLPAAGHEVVVLSACDGEPCDYPDVSYAVSRAVTAGDAQRGILVCGTGIGACIAANKVPGIRAALVHDEVSAELSRRHNDANVLCLAGDLLSEDHVKGIVERWLKAPFDGGRHERRIRKITAIEQGQDPQKKEKGIEA